MKHVIKNIVVEVLPQNLNGMGEREFIPSSPKASLKPCWTTNSTCWCTCGGCSTLTRPYVAKEKKKQLSTLKNLEKELMKGVKELRRRQTLVRKAKGK